MTLQPESAHSPFRKAALDRINSPEQLDHLLTVTTPRSWIALTAVAALIGVALTWSLIGSLPTYVEGRGLFIREGGSIASAAAPGAGTLEKLLVQKGAQVEAGQIVAQIVAPEIEQQIASARALVVERQNELTRQRGLAADEIAANRTALGRREISLDEVKANAQRRADALREKLVEQQRLQSIGHETRNALLDTQAELDQSLLQVADAGDQITQLDIRLRELVFTAEQRVKNAEFELADAERQLGDRVEAYRVSSEVQAPVAGSVDEIQLHVGSLVARGQSVLTIETLGRGLGFVLFVPLREGDKLSVGQAVRIAPNWTVREEEGTMLGDVREVSKFPITPQGLQTLLHNEELVRDFSRVGPVFMAHVALTRDPASKSGYAWTSSKGADVPVESGNFAQGEVLVKTQRPISLAIPALRRWTGI